MKTLFLVLPMSFFWSVAVSQFDTSYTPLPVQDTIPSSILVAMKSKLASDKINVHEPSKERNKYASELYETRTKYVIEQFNEDHFIVDAELSPYLQGVLNGIYDANPSLPREAKVYAFRSEAVNAMSYGEGTIAFTLGLLARMETEAQIAFILCHELAHYHARHSDLKISEIARLNFDPQLKKKVKSIERSSYKQYSKFIELTTSLGLSITQHSREKEFEADSLALQFFLNTSYDLNAPVRTLEILDSADVSLHTANIDLKKYFNFNAYPFKEHWATYKPSTRWYADINIDSLQTHPSCSLRTVAIKRQISSVSLTNRKSVSFGSDQCNALRVRSEFEIAVSQFHFGEYGRGLFLYLLLLKRFPENPYAHAMVGQGLYHLYDNQKKHELGKMLALPDPRFDENYNRYLSFVHALRLAEIASLSYYYTFTKKDIFGTQEDFLFACWLASTTEVSKQDPAKIKKEYVSRFPSGKYINQIK